MTEFSRELIFGKRPIRRTDRKPGESEWYYLDPRGASTFSDMKKIDVPTENTPNPYANEIQNYLYKNDEYNYRELYGDTPPPVPQPSTQPATQPTAQENKDNNQNCFITFDGKNLKLYNNGKQIDNLDAQSGKDNFQSAKYQIVANKGPLPEGTYYANQNQRQNLTLKNLALKLGEKIGLNLEQKSGWSGNPVAWGIRRVWLEPDENTNTYGRSGFTIHGGATKGSAGCIDIPWQTHKLSEYLDNCQDSVPVRVKYPKDW